MARRCPPTRRTLRILAFLTLLLLFSLRSFELLPSPTRRYDTRPWIPCPAGSSPFHASCNVPRTAVAPAVQVIVKTGGSEPLERLRAQLATLLSEVPSENLLIFSDLEENVDGYRVHDIYANISQLERSHYPEFKLYDEQLAYKAQGRDTRELDGGWRLDKYKNLPIKRRIWQMQQQQQQARTHHHPLMKWFVFIDTDTFVEWDNLFGLLETMDPSEELYLGSPVWIQQTVPPRLRYEFAHGGSAYVLSYGALRTLNTVEPSSSSDLSPGWLDPSSPMYSQFGLDMSGICCGDDAVARALRDRGVRMKGYWPLFNGEIPATVAYGKDLWCEPVISLHHIGEQNLSLLWHWVAEWKRRTRNQQPLLFRDLFEYIAADFSSSSPSSRRRDNWHNMIDTPDRTHHHHAGSSFSACRAACDADRRCFQFLSHGTRCDISYSIRLGQARPPADHNASGDEERYISGWNTDRIRESHWVHSNP
ncbi:uncharacterized protein L3040_006048 [Drepanopeziza brunnea f. sp. 'multigermtubi']|uniref:uncharacterized protein n=1 Tax=Drepanopeziza brunnea f. sp. 'multigermtubi' TaxID=698441 RepID=UPI00238A5AE1|nr:hypothetical protein L3040_006048 [Drepanopeziza brunnea f. sp. 'multigermtubi']